MRFEGAGLYWLIGIGAVCGAWWMTTSWRSRWQRILVRSIVLGFGLGVAMVPGQSDIVIAPSMQLVVQGLLGEPDADARLKLGLAYSFGCFAAALASLLFWRPREPLVASVTVKLPDESMLLKSPPKNLKDFNDINDLNDAKNSP